MRLREVARDLGGHVPQWIAPVVLAADLVVLALLVASPQVGGAAAAAYLLVVTIPFLLALQRGRVVADCGCGSRREPGGLHLLARNAVLGAAALILVFGEGVPLIDLSFTIGAVAVLLSRLLPTLVERVAQSTEA